MKHKFRRYLLWVVCLIVSIAVLAIVFLSHPNGTKANIFLGLCATLITIFISIINYYQTSDKFFKELFTDFNQRYDKLNNFLNQVKENDILDPDEKQRVIDYLNLCAEEYMWVKKGRLPEDIWHSWENGINVHLKKEPIKKIFMEEKEFWQSSYYGLFDDIKL